MTTSGNPNPNVNPQTPAGQASFVGGGSTTSDITPAWGESLPAWTNTLVALLASGQNWPKASEVMLWALAQEHLNLGNGLRASVEPNVSAVRTILSGWDVPATPAFLQEADQLFSQESGLTGLGMEHINKALQADEFARETQYSKISINVAFWIAVIATAIALIAAFFSAGATTSWIGPIAASARANIIRILERLALVAGREFGAGLATRLAGTAPGGVLRTVLASHLGRELIEEIGEEIFIDAYTQREQMALGTRRGWDWKRTTASAVGAGGGAVVGMKIANRMGRLSDRIPLVRTMNGWGGTAPGIGNAFARFPGRAVQTGLNNMAASPGGSILANALVYGEFQLPDGDAFLGAAMGGAGRANTISPFSPDVLAAVTTPVDHLQRAARTAAESDATRAASLAGATPPSGPPPASTPPSGSTTPGSTPPLGSTTPNTTPPTGATPGGPQPGAPSGGGTGPTVGTQTAGSSSSAPGTGGAPTSGAPAPQPASGPPASGSSPAGASQPGPATPSASPTPSSTGTASNPGTASGSGTGSSSGTSSGSSATSGSGTGSSSGTSSGSSTTSGSGTAPNSGAPSNAGSAPGSGTASSSNAASGLPGQATGSGQPGAAGQPSSTTPTGQAAQAAPAPAPATNPSAASGPPSPNPAASSTPQAGTTPSAAGPSQAVPTAGTATPVATGAAAPDPAQGTPVPGTTTPTTQQGGTTGTPTPAGAPAPAATGAPAPNSTPANGTATPSNGQAASTSSASPATAPPARRSATGQDPRARRAATAVLDEMLPIVAPDAVQLRDGRVLLVDQDGEIVSLEADVLPRLREHLEVRYKDGADETRLRAEAAAWLGMRIARAGGHSPVDGAIGALADFLDAGPRPTERRIAETVETVAREVIADHPATPYDETRLTDVGRRLAEDATRRTPAPAPAPEDEHIASLRVEPLDTARRSLLGRAPAVLRAIRALASSATPAAGHPNQASPGPAASGAMPGSTAHSAADLAAQVRGYTGSLERTSEGLARQAAAHRSAAYNAALRATANEINAQTAANHRDSTKDERVRKLKASAKKEGDTRDRHTRLAESYENLRKMVDDRVIPAYAEVADLLEQVATGSRPADPGRTAAEISSRLRAADGAFGAYRTMVEAVLTVTGHRGQRRADGRDAASDQADRADQPRAA